MFHISQSTVISKFQCYRASTFRQVIIAYNNVFRYLLGVCGKHSISQTFVEKRIDNYKVLLRKSVFCLLSRISVSDNNLVATLYGSSYFMYSSNLYKRWQTVLYVQSKGLCHLYICIFTYTCYMGCNFYVTIWNKSLPFVIVIVSTKLQHKSTISPTVPSEVDQKCSNLLHGTFCIKLRYGNHVKECHTFTRHVCLMGADTLLCTACTWQLQNVLSVQNQHTLFTVNRPV